MGVVAHHGGDRFEGFGERLHRLVSSGGQRPLDRSRGGVDDAQQYPGGAVGNRTTLLPLLHRAQVEAEHSCIR